MSLRKSDHHLFFFKKWFSGSTTVRISDIAGINLSLYAMNSPEKEATDDEAVRAGVPSVAAAGRAQEGQGAAPLLRGLQEAGPAGGRRRQGAGRRGVQGAGGA